MQTRKVEGKTGSENFVSVAFATCGEAESHCLRPQPQFPLCRKSSMTALLRHDRI